MQRVLDEGAQFVDVDADIDPQDLRGWSTRLSKLALELADCVEAPARNRVMEVLSSPGLPDDANALAGIRISVAGASASQLGDETGVSGRTIERIEAGNGCQVGVAYRVAGRFALSTSELFEHGRGDSLTCRTVAGLREAMTTPSSTRLRG
jgi:DNA-binding XRE family transcriptional regulator